eukprot:9929829-Lingulodinium_polyedra.AAC.1
MNDDAWNVQTGGATRTTRWDKKQTEQRREERAEQQIKRNGRATTCPCDLFVLGHARGDTTPQTPQPPPKPTN